jgi:hypothetical protein
MTSKVIEMKRVIFKFKDGTFINIQGDYLARDEEYITAWDGENLVAMVAKELIRAVYISEKA